MVKVRLRVDLLKIPFWQVNLGRAEVQECGVNNGKTYDQLP